MERDDLAAWVLFNPQDTILIRISQDDIEVSAQFIELAPREKESVANKSSQFGTSYPSNSVNIVYKMPNAFETSARVPLVLSQLNSTLDQAG